MDRRQRDAFSDEMLRRLAQSPEMASIRHTLQVTSYGGSGTSALYEHLLGAGADIPMTIGQFPFKHQRIPPADAEVPAGFRVVYLFADPRNAVVSLFRRGFQGGHYRGMRLQKPTPEAEHRLIDLDHFLDAQVDDFELADHFERWHARASRTYPVLFLRYEALGDAWPTVRDFLGLSADVPCLPIRARASEWQLLPDDARERLEVMYGDMARLLAALPAVEVR
jgi:hypothetical protein